MVWVKNLIIFCPKDSQECLINMLCFALCLVIWNTIFSSKFLRICFWILLLFILLLCQCHTVVLAILSLQVLLSGKAIDSFFFEKCFLAISSFFFPMNFTISLSRSIKSPAESGFMDGLRKNSCFMILRSF